MCLRRERARRIRFRPCGARGQFAEFPRCTEVSPGAPARVFRNGGFLPTAPRRADNESPTPVIAIVPRSNLAARAKPTGIFAHLFARCRANSPARLRVAKQQLLE